jgi:hypothetical protein
MIDSSAPEPAAPPRRSLRLRRVLGGLVATWVLYVAGFELAVRTGFAERLVNRRPHKLAVSFETAHSWFPGWATVSGIEARGQALRLRWRAHVDQASGWLVPWRLASRRLRLAGVKAEGIEFSLLRESLEASSPEAKPPASPAPPSPAAAESAPALPASQDAEPSPGASTEPSVLAPSAPLARAAFDLDLALPVIPPLAPPPPGPAVAPRWTIEIAGYDATGVREIWMDRFRITTTAKATGALTLHLPTREIELLGTALEFRDSTLHAGDLILGEALAGKGDLAVARYPYQEDRGLAVLAHVTAAVQVAGRFSGGRFWFASMPPQAWLQLDDRTAEISGEIRLVEGELQPGTRIEFRQEDYEARAFDFHVTGDVLGSFEVASDAAGAKAEGHVNFHDYAIRRSAAPLPDLVGTGLSAVATTRDLHLERLATMQAEARLELGEAVVQDLSRLSHLMPPSAGVALVGGSGRAGGGFDLQLPALAGRGGVQIALDNVEVKYGGLDLHGRMRIDLALATAALPAGHFDLAGTSLALTEFQIPQLAGEKPPTAVVEEDAGWWARIELPEGEIDLPPGPAARGRLRVRLRDSVPFIGLFETRRNLPKWVERLLTVHDLQAESGFAYEAETFTLDEFSMPFKKASIRARVRFGAEHKTGILLVGWRKLGLGVRFDDERRRMKLLGARNWYAAQGLDLSTIQAEVDPAETFSEEALASVSFSGLAAEPLSLVDSELAELAADDGIEAAPAPFEIVPGSIARGDLDGDGREEAAVLLSLGGGGESPTFFLAALDEQGGRPENVATVALGSRPAAGRLSIAGGRIVLEAPASPAEGLVPEPLAGAQPPQVAQEAPREGVLQEVPAESVLLQEALQEVPAESVPPPPPAPEVWRLAGHELLVVPAAPAEEPVPASVP